MENQDDIKVKAAKQSLDELECLEYLKGVSGFNGISHEEYKKSEFPVDAKFVMLEVKYEHYKAELTVGYWWRDGGRVLNSNTLQYRVTSNGNNKGNLFFGVWGDGGAFWYHELTGGAIQDGEWHDLVNGGAVTSPNGKGGLYFKYIFDRSNAPDYWAHTSLPVSYIEAAKY